MEPGLGQELAVLDRPDLLRREGWYSIAQRARLAVIGNDHRAHTSLAQPRPEIGRQAIDAGKANRRHGQRAVIVGRQWHKGLELAALGQHDRLSVIELIPAKRVDRT